MASRFKPGQSGNPGGKPRNPTINPEAKTLPKIVPHHVSLTAILKEILQRVPDGEHKTNAELIMDKLVEMAKGGDRQAIKDVHERVDGKVPDQLAVSPHIPTADDLVLSLTAAEERYEHVHRNGHSEPKELDPPGDGASAGEPGPVQ